MTDHRPVAVLTAAAHRSGKHIALAMAEAGWDLSFWGLAAMRARSQQVRERGAQAVACRGNILDPLSITFMLSDTLATYATIDAAVHVAADHLLNAPGVLDLATDALSGHGLRHVVYVDDGSLDRALLRDQVDMAKSRGLDAHVVQAATAQLTRQPIAMPVTSSRRWQVAPE